MPNLVATSRKGRPFEITDVLARGRAEVLRMWQNGAAEEVRTSDEVRSAYLGQQA